jgi:hypothetical protein
MVMHTDNQSSSKLQLNILDCSKEIYTKYLFSRTYNLNVYEKRLTTKTVFPKTNRIIW